MNRIHFGLYGGCDPREMPTYTLQEAARYTGVPFATLRSWIRGRYYPTEGGQKFFQPIITRPDQNSALLSFMNLVEVHVLSAIRRQYDVRLNKVRSALDYLNEQYQSKHPLADGKFETDGIDLFIERYGQLIDISRSGQLAMRSLLEAYLRRIDWDSSGYALRLYPFIRKQNVQEPKVIVIDPFISFGRPVLVGTGIPTAVIADRYKSGESIDELADDYGRQRLEIEEALRCELQAA